MKKSGIFIANIVLASVFGVFLMISAFVVIVIKSSFDIAESTYDAFDWSEELYGYGEDYGDGFYSDYEREVYELPVIQDAAAELIGTEYQGETAYGGYHYYAVTVAICNGGSEFLVPDYLYLSCEGDNADDVYMEFLDGEEWLESDLDYANLAVIPSCQTGEVRVIVQVKEGVTDIRLILDRTYETGDVQTWELSLE